MSQDRDNSRFDTRIIEHGIRRGTLKPAEVNTFLQDLPDDAEHAVDANVRFTTPFGDKHRRRR